MDRGNGRGIVEFFSEMITRSVVVVDKDDSDTPNTQR